MLRKLSWVLWLMVFAPSVWAQVGEQDQVQKAFLAYKTALLNEAGEAAFEQVDSLTVAYYGQVLDWVRNADSTQVGALDLMDRFMVFLVRHRTEREQVLSFDAKAMFIYAVESGMVGKESVAANEMGAVTIQGKLAQAPLVVGGQALPLNYTFYKEGGQWKLNLTSLMDLSRDYFKKMAEESGKSENDFLFLLLKIVSGREVEAAIWKQVH